MNDNELQKETNINKNCLNEDNKLENEKSNCLNEDDNLKKEESNNNIINSLKENFNILNDKYIRIMAEYDNYRKRSLKERNMLFDNISSEIISNFLEIYDSILRAVSLNQNPDIKGNKLILKQFEDILKKLNVKKIETNIKSQFDPNFHNAIIHINDNQYGQNEIIEILNDGFQIGNKVIRHAIVKVAN